MDMTRIYRQQADDCLALANESDDVFVKLALADLAAEFERMADEARPPMRRSG
jgi:hypothetical protein